MKDQTKRAKEEALPEKIATLLAPEYQGKWIAWGDNHEQILAADDTYLGLMKSIEKMKLVDPQIERAPVLHSALSAEPIALLEDESTDILADLRATIPDVEDWLDTPNTRLWFKKPRDLIGTPQERYIYSPSISNDYNGR